MAHWTFLYKISNKGTFKISDKIGVGLKEAYINGIPVTFNTVLKNGGIVSVKSDNVCNVKEEWKDWAISHYAKIKIDEVLNNN